MVKTNLLTAAEWQNFPQEYFTPIKKIVDSVLILLDGKDGTEGNRPDGEPELLEGGKKGVLWGEAIEISGTNHYYREAPKICDDAMRAVMKATDMPELKG